MVCYTAGILLLLTFSTISESTGNDLIGNFLRPEKVGNDGSNGTRWAVLVAGSKFYWNYRHQADVCHAYQILKKNGLKDEKIVVFMYDDIAFNKDNPRPGVIINSPQGSDVYKGVPKDYTGENVTINNLFSVILGNRSALRGGSGKVVDSGPDDRIFIYYADHGGAGMLGMPNEDLYAVDLIEVLKKKHASGTYKSLVFYLEACEAGSIFDGLLAKGLNIYVTTASNTHESSYGTYCTGEHPSPPPEYVDTCLGDLYSVAWMEDCDSKDLQTETLEQQYKLVKKRTKDINYKDGSHVMQYGDLSISKDYLSVYMGTSTTDGNFTYLKDNSERPSSAAVNQRDTDLLYFWHKYTNAPEGSTRKFEAQKQFTEVMSHRTHVDDSVKLIGKYFFGVEKGPDELNAIRPAGQPLVDDWDCLKTLVKTFEAHCGSLSRYGLKYMRSFANLCNLGITKEQMTEASARTCVTFPSNSLSSLQEGFRA